MAMIASIFSTAALNRHSVSSSEAIWSSEGGASDATATSPRARSLRRRSRRSSRAHAPAEMRTQSTQKLLRSRGASSVSASSWAIALSSRARAESRSLTRVPLGLRGLPASRRKRSLLLLRLGRLLRRFGFSRHRFQVASQPGPRCLCSLDALPFFPPQSPPEQPDPPDVEAACTIHRVPRFPRLLVG